jgi:hypothetical protein
MEIDRFSHDGLFPPIRSLDAIAAMEALVRTQPEILSVEWEYWE